ncbi:MAG TPA: serine/threonine-protein kinase [Roseiflexaceae bacterium]|nr:serine/threonine-protein kinase [Roseiflexaceae bacterium]
MRCPTCQYNNPAGAPFCAECGTRLAPTGAPAGLVAPTGTLPQQLVLAGRYVIEQKLGQGGMGAVYRARDLRLATAQWAIKEMSQSAITSPLERQQARDAFRQEAELLAMLSHPNLPRVVDHFEQDGKAYLVMEFVPGESLLDLAQREGLPLPLPRVLEWARQICEVLEYLHAQSPPVIFRDLKPANVMITPRGQVKLIDFGIARLFKPGKARDTQAFGTMGYSAPEQYGRGQTDARSDVYALGVLLHQLLTGYDPTATPFRLPPAAQLNPSLPAYLSEALARATESDPERRFPDVRSFHMALLGAPGQVLVQPQVEGQHAYARPESQPFAQHQLPAGTSMAGPANVPGVPPTTGLANASRWIGAASAAVMALALLFVGLAALRGDTSSGLAGAGYLLGLLPLASGPLAFVLGLVALTQPQTASTLNGRRHATIGVATGAATLLLCCVIVAVAGSVGGGR